MGAMTAPTLSETTPSGTARSGPARSVTALSATRLTKRYGGREVVRQLDLEVPTGVVAGFVGPNGAGKTTTMAMLLGLVRPTAGTATVLGASIEHPAAYLPRVGALIESPAFYPALTGVENLRVFATVGGHDTARIPSLVALVGLDGRGGDRYRSYSLGMKQRLGIAAALLGDPELLILDEPANGLDPEGVREMRGLIGRLAETGRTVLVSSHDLSELEQVCDWLVLIDTGRSLYQGPTRELLDGSVAGLVVVPQHAADQAVLEDLLVSAGHQVEPKGEQLVIRLDGNLHDGTRREGPRKGGGPEVDVGALAASVNRAAFDAGVVLVELSPLRTTLEDRYLSLVRGGAR
jgi:ABC-2 type transport system ATP-binding protein